MKKTVVFGASENPERYAHKAVLSLQKHGHEIVAIGKSAGEINGVKILTGTPEIKNVDTVTIYLNERNQKPLMNYILSLNPERIIFNPGAENPELANLAAAKGIETTEACTLVMLSIGAF